MHRCIQPHEGSWMDIGSIYVHTSQRYLFPPFLFRDTAFLWPTPRLKVSLSISSYLLLFLSKPAVWPASAGHFIRALCCISSFLPSIISFSWYTYRMAYPNFRFQILLIPQRTDDRHIINLWRERLEESGDASLFSSTFNFVLLFFTKYSMYMQGSQFCSVNCRESYCWEKNFSFQRLIYQNSFKRRKFSKL